MAHDWIGRVDRKGEQRLIAQAVRGDSDAFAALYRAHVQAIYRYIVHRVSDAQMAEDFTADVFTRALKSMSTYQDQGKPFLAWLYRIAHARVVDYYRRRGRRPDEAELDAQPIAVTDDVEGELLRGQAASALRTALSSLTDEQQQVIILRFIEGLNLEETAVSMGKNANAIKALQHRALRALASRLERSGFDLENILSGLS
jgi:RNA polymerase sigma-70 factor (ECF subfamily)